MPKNYSDLVLGLEGLKTGALLQIILQIAYLGVLFIITLSIRPYMSVMTGHESINPDVYTRMYLVSTLSLYLMLAIGILYLIIIYRYWLIGTKHLEDYDLDRLGIGRIGITLSLIGIGILVLAVAGVIISYSKMSPPDEHIYYGLGMSSDIITFYMRMSWLFLIPSILGGGILIIGMIMFSIMLIRLGKMEGIYPSLHTAGIILLIGIVLSIPSAFNILGWILIIAANILIYNGSRETVGEIRSKML